MNGLRKKFERKRSQFFSDVFILDWRRFCRMFPRETGKRLGRCAIHMQYGTVLRVPSLFIGYYKALQENGSKSGPIKEFEATPTQSLATSGRFARKSIRPDLSHFALWHTTLCWRLAYLSEIMFKLRLDSKYVITAYLSLFLFQVQRTTKTHRANRLKSGRTNVRWNDLIPKWPLDKPRRT